MSCCCCAHTHTQNDRHTHTQWRHNLCQSLRSLGSRDNDDQMTTDLLSTCLKHYVLLALVNATFSRRPKLQNDVFLFQQLVQRHCSNTAYQSPPLTATHLTPFTLLLGLRCQSTCENCRHVWYAHRQPTTRAASWANKMAVNYSAERRRKEDRIGDRLLQPVGVSEWVVA